MPKMKAKKSKKGLRYIVVRNKLYGISLQGKKIFYEKKKPKGLNKDGSIKFGKHILQALNSKFGDKYHWIITPKDSSIVRERKIYRIRTSEAILAQMGKQLWDRTSDIKHDIVRNVLAATFPDYFERQGVAVYTSGTLARILNGRIISRLSPEDREAIIAFIPDFIASESLNSVNLLKAETQIKTLREMAIELEEAIGKAYSEGWWQKYIKKNILIIQQGYIQPIPKMNIGLGKTKFPDFSLVTHDGYLDILEIKKPNTALLKLDNSRGNYYWDTEIAKALIQVENYIENVSNQADRVRSYILDNLKLTLKVLRPRGIVLAGDARKLNSQKEKDDFRLLSLSSKNVVFVTYDELLARLNNYIKVLEDYSISTHVQ